MFKVFDDIEKDKTTEEGKEKKAEITNLTVTEVSIVDAPANQITWLVLKSVDNRSSLKKFVRDNIQDDKAKEIFDKMIDVYEKHLSEEDNMKLNKEGKVMKEELIAKGFSEKEVDALLESKKDSFEDKDVKEVSKSTEDRLSSLETEVRESKEKSELIVSKLESMTSHLEKLLEAGKENTITVELDKDPVNKSETKPEEPEAAKELETKQKKAINEGDAVAPPVASSEKKPASVDKVEKDAGKTIKEMQDEHDYRVSTMHRENAHRIAAYRDINANR